MGVNAPARTVIFHSLRKHDGKAFRRAPMPVIGSWNSLCSVLMTQEASAVLTPSSPDRSAGWLEGVLRATRAATCHVHP
jgi:hypothetical protein